MPCRAALVGELLQRVARERRPVDDVVARRLRREHREAVVVARRDRDVADAGAPWRVDTHSCASNLIGIERRREPLVVVDGDAAVLHHPFALTELAVDAPVDEHPELRVAKPFARGGALRRDVVRCHLRPSG